MTFLSQLDPVYFTNSVNKETIEKSYKSFFQIFGGQHVSQDYFKTRTKEEQVSMYGGDTFTFNKRHVGQAISSSLRGGG